MMRAVIIEDEDAVRKELAALLATHCPMVELVGMAQDGPGGMALVMQEAPELVFLDIHLPGMNGFELLAALQQYAFEVVFITGHSQYGIAAVKASALDYLLKPVRPEELMQAVWKAMQKKEQGHTRVLLENLLQHTEQVGNPVGKRLALPSLKEIRLLAYSEILMCEAANNYTRFYLVGGEKLLVSMGLYEFRHMEKLGFFCPKLGQLVNINHVQRLLKEDAVLELLLSNGERVVVSRRRKEAVMHLFNRRSGGQ